MRVLLATVQVPFVSGGAETLAAGLLDALRREGHEAEIVAIPFEWSPPERVLDHMLACRLLDLTGRARTPVDRVIGLKFPAYLIPHPNKVLWLLHQHRTAYDLWEHPLNDLRNVPNGLPIRDAIRRADSQLIPQAKAIFTISGNVSRRLKTYNGIDSTPLYNPPPSVEKFYCADAEDYFFFPSRLNPLKRQSLVLEALAITRKPVRIRFAGTAEDASYLEALKKQARRLNVHNRIDWVGHVSEQVKHDLYAHSLGVIFPPVDEDYGYITLEAMLASKPVITCTDSGGPLEFVRTGETGLVAEPTPESLADAMDTLWNDRAQAKQCGQAARSHYNKLGITWQNVVRTLLP